MTGMSVVSESNPSVPASASYSLLRDNRALAFVLCFLAAFAVLLEFNFSDIDEQIAATEREQSGLVVSVYLRDLLTDLQDSRGYSAMYLGGDVTMLEKVAANHYHMGQDIKNYAAVTGTGIASLHLHQRWDHLARRIEVLRVPKSGDSSAQSFADHTAVIEELLDLLYYVGDRSGLVLEQDYDTYHLIDSVLMPMPILVEYIAKMRGLAAGAVARHSVSANERRELGELRGAIKAEINHIEEISDRRYEGSKKVVDEIKPNLDEALNATQHFIGMIQNELLESGGSTLVQGALYDVGSLAMDAYLKFFDRTVSVLDALLQQRIQAQSERRYAVVLIVIVIVLMVLSGLYFYARSRAVRTRAEQALQDTLSKLKLQKYAIDEHAIVSIADRRGIITYVNSKFCAVSQYAAEELIGHNHNILNSGYHTKEFFREMWATIGGGKVWSGEIRNCGKNSALYWVQSTIVPHLDAAGRVSEYISIRTDITAQKLAQQQAHERERRFVGLVENMTDLAWELDAQGRITYCSGSIDRILGYRPDEIMTRTPFDLMPPEEGERMKRIFTELAAGQKPIVNLEHMNLTKDGRLIHMISNGIPLSNAAGDLAGYLCVASDVTARIAVDQERQSAHEATLRASQAKSEFLAMMSHEIRTPMNGVMGMLQLMQGTTLDPIQRDLLATAYESSGMLLNMLNTILDFSKVTTSRIDLDPVEFDPCELIETVTHPLLLVAQERGIALRYICASGVPQQVCGDVLRLRQVLTNLLSNALKFTERGSITVRVMTQETTAGMKRLRFEVADTGIGVDPEAQTRIFNAFEQADSSTTRRYGGSGLGLALCKQLVELMGGEISVASSSGQGSTFAFEVSVECRPEENCGNTPGGEVCGSANEEMAVPSRRRVLVVDDNRVNRRVARQMLIRLGCNVDEATGGLEALKRIPAGCYDLVLLDCQMPDIDGYAVASLFRASEAPGNHVPIVAMTADAMMETRERCLDAGMDDYLSKPLDISRLGEILKTYCVVKDSVETGNLQLNVDVNWCGIVPPDGGDTDAMFSGVEALRPLLSVGFEAMVGGFVDDADAYVGAMSAALTREDSEELVRAAHILKGSAGNLGLTALSKLCGHVLEIARGNVWDRAVAGAVDAVALEWARLRDGLRSIAGVCETVDGSATARG